MVDLDGEQYLTGEEAASLLGIKRETLYAYVSRGYLKSYRQGIKRQRLYRRSEVEDLLRLSASSSSSGERAERASLGVSPEDIPLAESWIRD
jgi:citrate synthase